MKALILVLMVMFMGCASTPTKQKMNPHDFIDVDRHDRKLPNKKKQAFIVRERSSCVLACYLRATDKMDKVTASIQSKVSATCGDIYSKSDCCEAQGNMFACHSSKK